MQQPKKEEGILSTKKRFFKTGALAILINHRTIEGRGNPFRKKKSFKTGALAICINHGTTKKLKSKQGEIWKKEFPETIKHSKEVYEDNLCLNKEENKLKQSPIFIRTTSSTLSIKSNYT